MITCDGHGLETDDEVTVRALPEYQSYFELLAAILSGMLDGQRPGPKEMAAAGALMVDMFTAPSKLAFLHRAAAELCFAEGVAERDTLRILAVGAGGFDILSALVAEAAPGARIEYRVVAGWPQIARGIAELGRERFPGVSFGSFAPMAPGALAEHLGGGQYDVVIVNLQDPCAQEAPRLLEKLVAGADGPMVFVIEPIETQGLELILDLSGMWPQAGERRGASGAQALAEVLARGGYLQRVVAKALLTVYGRARQPGMAEVVDEVDEAQVADIRAFLLQTLADAVDDEAGALGADQRLADANLPSISWALVFSKLRQRFGEAIGAEFFAGLDADESVASLSVRLARQLQGGAGARARVLAVPDGLPELVMARLADAGRTEVVLAHADRLAARAFTSSRGQVIEYFECGSGPALVFLTALAFSKSVWEDQIREFGGDYRLIFPHLPGHAGSIDTGVDFTFEQLADDLVELMDALKVEQANLVGWCMAGNIAQLLALRHPQRLKSLALVCTTPTDARMRGITGKELEEYSVSPLLTYQMELNNIYKEGFLLPEVSRHLALVKQSQVPVAPRTLLNFIDSLFRFDTRNRLQQLKMPTLVVAGSYDIAFPIDQVALLRDGIRHCRFLVLERSGHLPFLTQSAEFNLALRAFLSETSVARQTAMK